MECGPATAETAVACYREFAPSERLREHVRAFFTFVPAADASGSPTRRVTRELLFAGGDHFVSPMFADANASIVVNLGLRWRADGVWEGGDAPSASMIGATTRVGAPSAGYAVMVGAYFQPARAAHFMGLPQSELTNRMVSLGDVWGAAGASLPEEMGEMTEEARVDRFEAELLRWLARRPARTSVDVQGLAEWTRASQGRVSVERMAESAGVSRQHLSRVFHEQIGVSPKQFSRLARFHSALGFVKHRERVSWSRVATELGYADQSHMIAQFREFTSLTPQQIVRTPVFHPFIENARASQPR